MGRVLMDPLLDQRVFRSQGTAVFDCIMIWLDGV